MSSDPFGDVFATGGAQLQVTALPGFAGTGHPVVGWEVADLGEAMRGLKERGVVFTVHGGFGQDAEGVWTAPDAATRLAWFADPDGNVLKLSQTMA